MKQVAVTDLAAYFDDEITAMPNLVTTAATTVGALNSGSITSGFGSINNGSSTITTTGLITGGSLDIDDVVINGTTIGHTDDTDLITVASGLVTVAGEISVTTLDIGGTNVTSTAAELNIMDGVTATTAELNLIDGDTTATSTTLAAADRLIVNDAGTMKQVALSDFETFFESALDTTSNITTVGALNSGSITSGFGTIDTGSSTITTTGLITGGSLDIDDVLINGSTIGHTDDTDLITVANGLVTVAGEISVTTLDIGGTNVTSTAAELNILDGVTATTAELNYSDTGSAVGTVVASKVVTADANKDVASFRNITLTGELDAGSLDVSGDADIDGTLEADAMTLNGTAITTVATLSTGISNGNLPVFTSGAADNDFLRIDGTSIEGRSASEVLSDIAAAPAAGSSNIVTTGALNSGSITSGFGSIDNGSSAITTTGVITGGTLEATADTSAGDNAAIGFTSAEGLILTGQGSTSDITLKNDADATVFSVPTGTDDILFPDSAKAMFGASSDLKLYHDGSHSYIEDSGTGNLRILAENFQVRNSGNSSTMIFATPGGSVQLYHNNSTKLETSSSGVDITGNVTATGTVEPAGDTAAGDNAAIGYTSAEGLILTGQGSTSDITLKNDADTTVFTVPTGTDDILFPDSAKILMGAGSDLQIYHDGSASYIDDAGTGAINIRGDNGVAIKTYNDNDNMVNCVKGGAVQVYHNGTEKLATTSYGIDISGAAVADTHNVSSASGAYDQNFDTYQNFKYEMSGNVTLSNPSTEKAGQSGHMIFIQDGTGSRTLSIGTDYETAGGAGITLSTAANATDIVPYVVLSANRILLGAPQKAFS